MLLSAQRPVYVGYIAVAILIIALLLLFVTGKRRRREKRRLLIQMQGLRRGMRSMKEFRKE